MARVKIRSIAIEPRRARRITKVLPVQLTVLRFAANRLARHPLSVGDNFGGRTINISRTGLQVHSDYELDPKTQVRIEFSLFKGGPRMHLITQVAWARRNAFDFCGRWAMGMRLEQAEAESIQAMEKFFRESG